MELVKDRRRGDRRFRLLASLATLGLFYLGLFVWPTPWRYEHVGKNPIRTNRVTQDVEILNLQGWQPAFPPWNKPLLAARLRANRRNRARPCPAPSPSDPREEKPIAAPPRPVS